MLDMFMEGKRSLAYALKLLTRHNFIVKILETAWPVYVYPLLSII